MNFFAVFLRKLEPSCEIGAYSAAILRRFRMENGCWRFLCHSIVHYSRLSRLQRGVESQYWRRDRVLRRGIEFPSQESCNLNVKSIDW